MIAEGAPVSAAARAELEEGEIILGVDHHRVATADAATTALQVPRKGGHLLRVRGGAGTRFVTIGAD